MNMGRDVGAGVGVAAAVAAMALCVGCGGDAGRSATPPAATAPASAGQVFTTGACAEAPTPIPVHPASPPGLPALPSLPGITVTGEPAPTSAPVAVDDSSISAAVSLARAYTEADLSRAAGETAAAHAARLRPMEAAELVADMGADPLSADELSLGERAVAAPVTAVRAGTLVRIRLRAVQHRTAPDGEVADYVADVTVEVVPETGPSDLRVRAFQMSLRGPC